MIELERYKAGRFEKGVGGYRYFMPSPVNEQWTWNSPEVNALLEKAAVKLGELNSFARLVPNIRLFIHLHVTKEAVVSSRIEGTQTNMGEALLPEEDISPERRNDWREVNNYVKAMNIAIDELEKLPISSRLLRQTHGILLNSVRGEHKQPGEFRTSQNWIGGSSPSDAVFVPPHFEYIGQLMSDLENFLHNTDIAVPALIRIAIAHYQFETIHPFLDGNGRIGRLLITLYLVSEKILSKPLLYLSSYFEENKSLYYDNLTFVRTKNDMTQWLKYFLVGIEQTATKAVSTLQQILELKDRLEQQITADFGRKSGSAIVVLQHLFHNPVLHVGDIVEACQIGKKAANSVVADFERIGILKEMTGQSRNRVFVFEQYLDLFSTR
ncbi:Fic family protein [Rufibacter sediminis]|uniref:Fic family protein n=1 Tax=Rufibacter sediminis TaxID=2762756 RepID=UPI001888E338|nr:Fic family protein [Rufibacter sediminis]